MSDRSPSVEVDICSASPMRRCREYGAGRHCISARDYIAGRGRRARAQVMARRLARWVRTLPLLGALACDAAGTDASVSHVTNDTALADTLMLRIADAYDFTRPDVIDAMAGLYPDTGRVIAASGGYVTTTVDSLRQGLEDFWSNVGVNMRDAHWEWGDVHVDRLGPDAAVLTGTWSIPHIAPTGNPHTIRGAWTAVFRRTGGEWLIVQEHLSVPPEGTR